MELRPYQREAVDSIYRHLREHDDNPCAVLPTAAGKTPVMATICKEAVGLWGGRVIILAHVKELLQQAADKLNLICPEIDVGVYSAGLKRRDTEHPVIIAGIQSVYKRAAELGHFDLAIVDEAHLIPPDGEGMYRTFLSEALQVNPRLRVIGLTATPFRMTTGMICAPENILNAVCYEVGVKELIVQGYLCPLVSKAGKDKADTSGLHIRGGEFIADEVEALMDTENLVRSACGEIVRYTRDRESCLIFASGIAHAEHIVRVLKEHHGVECGLVTGETPAQRRDEILARFRGDPLPGAQGALFGDGGKQPPRLKYLANVNVLTTGFDAPNIDCVALVRPTMSPGLYYQMVGRGFRLHPGKANCLVLDFGGNVLRHGPVDQIRLAFEDDRGDGEAPAKECPECHALIATGYAACPECGFVFPKPDRGQGHSGTASEEEILSKEVTTRERPVEDVSYWVHTKRDGAPNAPKTMRVEYRIGWRDSISEWLCFDHDGWARLKAESWWRERSDAPLPESVAEAVELARAGALAKPLRLTIQHTEGDKYERIIGYELGPKPDFREPGWDDGDEELVGAVADDDFGDIPF